MLETRPLHLITTCAAALIFASCANQELPRFENVITVAGENNEFGEPFGLAVKGDEIYVSDGESGRILRVAKGGWVSEFAARFDTPSGIAFAESGDLIVTDTGSHTVKSVIRMIGCSLARSFNPGSTRPGK